MIIKTVPHRIPHENMLPEFKRIQDNCDYLKRLKSNFRNEEKIKYKKIDCIFKQLDTLEIQGSQRIQLRKDIFLALKGGVGLNGLERYFITHCEDNEFQAFVRHDVRPLSSLGVGSRDGVRASLSISSDIWRKVTHHCFALLSAGNLKDLFMLLDELKQSKSFMQDRHICFMIKIIEDGIFYPINNKKYHHFMMSYWIESQKRIKKESDTARQRVETQKTSDIMYHLLNYASSHEHLLSKKQRLFLEKEVGTLNVVAATGR